MADVDERSFASSLSSPARSAAAAAATSVRPPTQDKSIDASPGMNGLNATFDSQLESDYDSLRAAHSALLQRVQSDIFSSEDSNSDEVERLRDDITQLKKDLQDVTQERDDLKVAVRDLRVRVEESRRAVMRLQSIGGSVNNGMTSSPSMGLGSATLGGGMQSSASSMSLLSPSEATFPSPAMSTIDKRKTIGPGGLPSWNPREAIHQPTSAGLGISAEPASMDDRGPAANDVEAKKAKRASIAFGPYAANVGTMGRKAHRRNGSTESEVLDSTGTQEPSGAASGSTINGSISNAGAAGLRGLRLSSAAPSAAGPATMANKRSSFVGQSIFRSPQPNALELNADAPQAPTQSTLGSLLMPMRSMSLRRSSNSSSVSGGGSRTSGQEGENYLGLPRSTSRASSTSASPGNTSPVMDRREGAALAGEADDNGRYRQPSVLDSHRGSLLQSVPQSVQKQLVESRERLADRESQLHALRKEMLAMRVELEETKKARAASDTCLKALREFANRGMASPSSSDGAAQGPVDILRGVKLPPLPTDDLMEEDEDSDNPANSAMNRQTSVQSDASSTTWNSFSRKFGSFSVRRPSIATPAPHGPPGSVNYGGKDTMGRTQSNNGLAPMPLLGKPRSPSLSTTALPGVATPRSPQIRSPRMAGMDMAGAEPAGALGLAREPPSPRRGMVTRYRNASGSSSSSTAGPNSAAVNNRRLSMQQAASSHDSDPTSPSGRARKAMEAAGSVDEDSGFVAPSFT